MKNRFKHIILFYFLYFFILFLFIMAEDSIILTCKATYQNIFLFALYIFFSQFLIFDIGRENESLRKIIKDIFDINLYIVFGIAITNIISFGIFSTQPNLDGILSLSLQLFLILVIISLFHYIIRKKGSLLIEYFYMMFIYLLYSLQSSYGDNLFFLNLYKYYFQEDSLFKMIIHYSFWIVVPIIIICFQSKHRGKKEVCVC